MASCGNALSAHFLECPSLHIQDSIRDSNDPVRDSYQSQLTGRCGGQEDYYMTLSLPTLTPKNHLSPFSLNLEDSHHLCLLTNTHTMRQLENNIKSQAPSEASFSLPALCSRGVEV